jgi:hypothetical protein
MQMKTSKASSGLIDLVCARMNANKAISI